MVAHDKLRLAGLTTRDARYLVRQYLTHVFVCGLMFGVPYVLFYGMTLGSDPASGSGRGRAPDLFLLVAMLIGTVTILPDLMKEAGRFLIKIGQAAYRASFFSRFIWLPLFAAALYILWYLGPTVYCLLFILVFLPGAWVLDDYKQLLLEKKERGESVQGLTLEAP